MEVFLTVFGACVIFIGCLGLAARLTGGIGGEFGANWAIFSLMLFASFSASLVIAIAAHYI